MLVLRVRCDETLDGESIAFVATAPLDGFFAKAASLELALTDLAIAVADRLSDDEPFVFEIDHSNGTPYLTSSLPDLTA